ncbi:Acyl-CoA-binding domain-containing protein 5, partial [Geodia barretti]
MGSDELWFNDLHRLALDPLEWREVEQRGNPPLPRDYSTLVTVSDWYLVLYGGSSAMSGNEEVFSDLHYIDITSGQITGTTSIITPSPFPLPSSSLLPFPNNNYISLKVFQIFIVYCACMHPDTRHKMFLCEVILALKTKRTGSPEWCSVEVEGGNSPPPRYGHSMVVWTNKLLVFGGQ